MRFDGGLAYNETGYLVIESTPGGIKWVGNPTPEMDALWDRVESGKMSFGKVCKNSNLLNCKVR